MPPEVISLLSSPLQEIQGCTKNAGRSRPPAGKSQASRFLVSDDDENDDEFPEIAVIVQSVEIPTSHTSLFKEPQGRTNNNSLGDNLWRKDNNDFLFLSDDFDTTGDFSFNEPRESQASSGGARNKNSTSRSMTRTSSTVVATKSCGPLQASGPKRWNSIADPIQHTSSPANLELEDDPFASSPPRRESLKGKQPVRAGPSLDAPPVGNKMPKSSTKIFDLSSDISDISPVQVQPKVRRQKVDWDPISSSMPETSRTRDVNDPWTSSPPKPPKRKADIIELDVSDSPCSDDEFPELSKVRADPSLLPRSLNEPARKLKRSKTAPATATAKKAPPMTQEEKDLEKKRKAEAREAEQERKRIEKEHAKKEKAVQKEKEKALAEVNKVRVNKSVAQVEMIVDLPESLSVGLSTQVTALLDEIKIDHKTWNSPIDHVVRWRRKVDKRYNEEKDYFEPIPLRLEQEKHVLVVIQGTEFVKLATGGEGVDVAAHVLKMKVAFPESTIIYLIEGLDQWFRKNRTARNRQFQSAARNQTNSVSTQARRRNAAHEIVDEEIVEDALLSLQVDHGHLIHKTNSSPETAQWITVFTQHISTIPYRKLRDDISTDAGFSVESGQVKTGETIKETYILMLQEVARVTAPMAYGIAAEYPTITELVRGLEQVGPLALENLRKSANADGRLTDQRIGQAISKRLYKILTCRDPTSTDI